MNDPNDTESNIMSTSEEKTPPRKTTRKPKVTSTPSKDLDTQVEIPSKEDNSFIDLGTVDFYPVGNVLGECDNRLTETMDFYDVGIYIKSSTAKVPTYATEKSACFDIYADIPHDTVVDIYNNRNQKIQRRSRNGVLVLDAGDRAMIPTGVIFDIPEGWQMKFLPRSGLALKSGFNLINCVGTIDEDFVDPSFVLLHNNAKVAVKLEHQERICQGELVPVHKVNFVVLDEAPKKKSDRNGGFGHTGSK